LRDEYLRVIEKYNQMFSDNDYNNFEELFTPNAIIEVFRYSIGEVGEIAGVNQIRDWHEFSFGGTKGTLKNDEIHFLSNKVFAKVSFNGEYWKLENRTITVPFNIKGFLYYSFDGFKIKRLEIFHDTFAYMKYLGKAAMKNGDKENINQYLLTLVNSGLVTRDQINFAK